MRDNRVRLIMLSISNYCNKILLNVPVFPLSMSRIEENLEWMNLKAS